MKLFFKLLLIAGIISGCSTQNEVGLPKKSSNIIISKNVQSDFKLLSVKDRVRADKLILVEVILLNHLSYSKEIGYKVTWLDAYGFEIKTKMSTWIYKKIGGNRKLIISAISPSTKANDYRIDIDYVEQIKENKIQ